MAFHKSLWELNSKTDASSQELGLGSNRTPENADWSIDPEATSGELIRPSIRWCFGWESFRQFQGVFLLTESEPESDYSFRPQRRVRCVPNAGQGLNQAR